MKNLEERGHLITEQVNPSQNLDQLSSELVDLFNREDAVAIACRCCCQKRWLGRLTAQLKRYATADDCFMSEREGRLGVLDAAECPPTL